MTADVVIAGGGPAGAIAATVLARAGARVLVLERGRFPRAKMCGDTVNPGAVALLERLGLRDVLAGGLPIEGMLVTGELAVRVIAAYPRNARGVALTRDVLDARLIECAAQAGAQVLEGVLAQGPALGDDGSVVGIHASTGDERSVQFRGRVIIAADGHFSRVARPLRLSRSARAPRRWALGAYFEGVDGLQPRGEMHVRAGYYLGVAPLPGGLTNACLVSADRRRVAPTDSLLAHLSRDPMLRERFAHARMIGKPMLMGPLAVDSGAAGMPGLLLAGDASGFIDPMTGDGLRFAFRGGELAALEAARVLGNGWNDAHEGLRRRRQREFGRKWWFNRTLRTMVARPGAVRGAAIGASIAPGLVRRVVAYAGDAA